ncbi:MAG: hypothetical protein RPS47_12620 [Colwellia sp.]|jgi:hypothetical protein
MNINETLYTLAIEVDDAWTLSERVDYSEAEQLIRLCSSVDKAYLDEMPQIKSLIEYADNNDEWDSAVISTFPGLIMGDLDSVEKQFSYRVSGDKWEVFGVYLSGKEKWTADVGTECLAKILSGVLNNGGAATMDIKYLAKLLAGLVGGTVLSTN